MDFVVGLSESKGYDAIWVVVDRLTKLRHMVPCKSTCSSEDLADLFLHNVWKHRGLPSTVISDRGPQFAWRFWKALCERLGIERRLSTGVHPQTDGQTERFNATMEEYLRLYVNHHHDDWCKGGGPWGPRLNIHRAYVLGKERRLSIGNVGFLDIN